MTENICRFLFFCYAVVVSKKLSNQNQSLWISSKSPEKKRI